MDNIRDLAEEDDQVYANLVWSSLYNFEDLPQSEFYHFLLKCSDGLFKGKFLYINTSMEGEIIGGGDYNSLTLHIEKANLSDKHWSIKFTPEFKYILKDLDSTDGTWVKIFDLNLSAESRERVYRVSDYEFVFLNSSSTAPSFGASDFSHEDSGSSKSSEVNKPTKMVIRKRGDKSSQTTIDLNKEKI